MRERAAFGEDGFEWIECRQVRALPEQANRDFVAPLQRAIHRRVEISRVVAHLFKRFAARPEELVGVVLVVGYARTEDIDQRESVTSI